MPQNRYFIVSLPEPALNAILEHCVQTPTTVRKSLDESKAIVKLPNDYGDGALPPGFAAFTELDHAGAKAETSTSDWQADLP